MTKIWIDAGHGGTDGGAGRKPYLEKEHTLKVALLLRDYLNKHFVAEVLMTRTTDKTVSLSGRTNAANRAKADYFISIHFNSGVASGHGYEDYIYNKLSDTSRTETIRTAIHNEVANRVLKKYNIRNRGRKKANFHVLRETSMPAMLAECLFVSNTGDQKIMDNKSFHSDMAAALGEGLAKALKLKKKATPKPTPKPPTKPKPTLYRVQAGAYKVKKNADDQLRKLKAKGFDCMVFNRDGLHVVQCGAYYQKKNAVDTANRIKKAGFDAFVKQT